VYSDVKRQVIRDWAGHVRAQKEETGDSSQTVVN